MWIVILATNKRHSAWNTKKEANKQKGVLEDYGYKGIWIRFDESVSCENGYYYV